jgi:glycosyltransferase involved in cell wall biosynthesis
MPAAKSSTGLRILWVCPYLPWPTIGGNRLRVFHLMRELAARGHRITLLAQSTCDADAATRAALGPLLERLIVVRRRRRRHPVTLAAAAFAPYPVDVSINGFCGRMRATMARLLDEHWDVVQVEHGYAMQSFLSTLVRRQQAFVLTEHNVESTLVPTNDYHPRIPRRLLPILHGYDAWRYRRWEAYELALPTRVIAVTAQDGERMAAIAKRPVDVIPNGADVAAHAHVEPDVDSARIMFIGNFAYPPNSDAVEWAVTEILPLVWQRLPRARFVVCGSAMPEEWKHRWTDPRIEWQGFVADIPAVQSQCAVFLASLRAGGGSKLKVLEAMAASLPVVSTPEGVSGLEAAAGSEYLLGKSAAELAAALVKVLSDPAQARKLGVAGRRYVAAAHSWSGITSQLERIYRSLQKTAWSPRSKAMEPLASAE